MAQVTLHGVPFAYDDRGDGAPVFLFVHGWGCDRTCWSAQLENLSADHRCIAIDLRGRGETPAVPPYNVGRAAQDLAAFIEALAIAPVVFVGHSLGGIIGLALNEARPELVLGLATIDSPITSDTGAASPRSVAMIREAGSMEAVRTFIESFNYDPPNPAAAEYIERVLLSCPADVGAGMLEDLHEVGARIGALIAAADRKPFMTVWAERPLGDPAWLRDNTMFVRQEPVAGTGHFVQIERPGVTNALLRAFLDDIDRDPRVSRP